MTYESYAAAQTYLYLAEQREREAEARRQRLGAEAQKLAGAKFAKREPRGFIPRIAGALGLF
jgi:hypothetical protein